MAFKKALAGYREGASLILPLFVLLWTVTSYSDWRDDRARAEARKRAGLVNYYAYECTTDCAEFRAGGEWAEARELDDGNACPRESSGFYQGCLAAIAWTLDTDQMDHSAALAGEEVVHYRPRHWEEPPAKTGSGN